MAIQVLNNNASMLEQRTKINANFAELSSAPNKEALTYASGYTAAPNSENFIFKTIGNKIFIEYAVAPSDGSNFAASSLVTVVLVPTGYRPIQNKMRSAVDASGNYAYSSLNTGGELKVRPSAATPTVQGTFEYYQ